MSHILTTTKKKSISLFLANLVQNSCPIHFSVKIEKLKRNILDEVYIFEFDFSVCLIFQIPVMAMGHMIIETSFKGGLLLVEQTKTIKLMIFFDLSRPCRAGGEISIRHCHSLLGSRPPIFPGL